MHMQTKAMLHDLSQEIENVQSLPCIEKDDAELHQLVDMLQNGYKRSIYNFEANYLHQFMDYFYLDESFQMKSTLKWIVEVHGRRRKMIRTQVMSIKSIDYSYIYNHEKRHFKFHNDMELHEDVLILLYLHNVISSIAYKTKPVQELLQILYNKYKIRNEYDDPEREKKSKHPITIYRLAVLFPSVSVSMFHQNMGSIAKQIDVLFPEIPNLPRAMYHHLMPMLIPRTTGKPPLALLIFIARKYLCICQKTKPSLMTSYKHILKLYKSYIYPEELKIRLCIYWNIVELYDTKLFFSHSIMNCNEHAKGLMITNMSVLASLQSDEQAVMDLSCKI